MKRIGFGLFMCSWKAKGAGEEMRADVVLHLNAYRTPEAAESVLAARLHREVCSRLESLIGPESGPVAEAPLLVQLQVAVRPSSGKGSGGSSGKEARAVINTGAMELLDDIRQAAADRWALITGEVRHVPTAEALRAWGRSLNGARCEVLAAAARQLSSWCLQIEGLFAPVRITELLGACPECGAEKVFVEDGAGGRTISSALFRADTRYAACRAAGCEAIWRGLSEMTTLSIRMAARQAEALQSALDSAA